MSASEFWNERYQAKDYIFGIEPNDFIKAVTSPASSGQKAYAPADGEGRNGVYLAQLGYDVTSTDVANLAVDKAHALAAQKGVALNALVGDALNSGFADASFDLIVVSFMHFLPEDHHHFMAENIRLLKPGGLFIMEGYTIDQIPLTSGGPKNPDMLMSAQSLSETFTDFDIILLQETRRHLTEGLRHQGEAATVQIKAVKK